MFKKSGWKGASAKPRKKKFSFGRWFKGVFRKKSAKFKTKGSQTRLSDLYGGKRGSITTIFKNKITRTKLNVRDVELLEGMDAYDLKKRFGVTGSKAKMLEGMVTDYKRGRLSLPGLSHKSKFDAKSLDKARLNQMIKEYGDGKKKRDLEEARRNANILKKKFSLTWSQGHQLDKVIEDLNKKNSKNMVLAKTLLDPQKLTKERVKKLIQQYEEGQRRNRGISYMMTKSNLSLAVSKRKIQNLMEDFKSMGFSQVAMNFAHLENPYFSIRKKHSDIPLPHPENVSLPTQTKRNILRKNVYKIAKVEKEKESNAKVRRQKSPIPVKRKQANITRTSHHEPKSAQIINSEKCTSVRKKSSHKPSKVVKKKGLERISNEQKRSEIKKTKNSHHDRNLELRLSSKIWHLMNRDMFPNLDKEKNADKIDVTDSQIKRHIISVVKKYNKKELKHCSPPRVTQTGKESFGSTRHHRTRSSNRKKVIKRKVRRRLWQWAKTAIRNNENWNQLFVDNNISLDQINIDNIDLSIIDLDAFGIENKLLKRTITWLFS